METLWYKNAVFYSLDVETFCDSNGDGVGDFKGLIQKLEYIHGLGADCIWLLPFYPSPNRDNGYDVMDYYNVDARLGDLGDFAELLSKAEALGMRIIIDLVVNHTSIKHKWFKEAKKDSASIYREYYVWSDKPKPFPKSDIMLQGEENKVWTFDRKAQQYYLHRFYKEQPDLNISNPAVRAEILKIMAFWLRLGVSGFRIDATEALIEPYGIKGFPKKAGFLFLEEMNQLARHYRKDALLLAEVAGTPNQMKPFLQDGSRMHMSFQFHMNQQLFLSLAKESKLSIEKALRAIFALPADGQWLQFLRHHDELNLRLLSSQEQEAIYKAFAPEKSMRIFGSGIRRRLLPLLNGNIQRAKLAYSLMFSLPGVPLLRYGDEIGMGENLNLPGRSSVRTPMQWSAEPAGGFSTATVKKLVHPVISSGAYSYKTVNMLHSQQDPSSLLNWVERLVTTRKQCPEIGYGSPLVISLKNKSILAHAYEWKGQRLVLLHNLSAVPATVTYKELGEKGSDLIKVFGDENEHDAEKELLLPGYSYRWLRSSK